MGGGGLLIFYVANVSNVANVIQVHFVAFCDTFWHIQDSRRIRHLRRTSTQNHTLTVIARNACPGTQASRLR